MTERTYVEVSGKPLPGFTYMTAADAAARLAERRNAIHARWLRLWAKRLMATPDDALVPLKERDALLASKHEVCSKRTCGLLLMLRCRYLCCSMTPLYMAPPPRILDWTQLPCIHPFAAAAPSQDVSKKYASLAALVSRGPETYGERMSNVAAMDTFFLRRSRQEVKDMYPVSEEVRMM